MRSMRTHKGYVHLGSERRWFAISMFHQLHCVNIFRKSLSDPAIDGTNENHVQHCMSYLRQFFLCAADDTLEPGDFEKKEYVWNRMGHIRVCRDWSSVYDAAAENWEEWKHSINEH